MKDETNQQGGITFQQMQEATRYVTSYLKFSGMDPALDYPETEKDIPKTWPPDVRKAWETVDLFYKQNEGIAF